MQLVLEPAAPDAPWRATVAFLEPSGERHQGVERRIELGPAPLDELARTGSRSRSPSTRCRAARAWPPTPLDGGLARVAMCVHNTTPVAEGLDRAGGAALIAALHPPGRARARRPLRLAGRAGPERRAAVAACDHVNTFPVLASAADDAVLGAAIVLPDHPQIAPESHGDLFDATEIEEALLLHVLALSDGERDAIAEQDPAVREMLERAEAAGPEEIARLHGRVTIADPARPPARPRRVAGEARIVVDGVTYRRGRQGPAAPGLRAAPRRTAARRPLATIERIYLDYDDGVHLGVTVDDDPGQELMRDIGRYLYFKPAEVEVDPT